MLRLLKICWRSTRLFHINKYSTTAFCNSDHSSYKTIQVFHFSKYDRKRKENDNCYKFSSIPFTWGIAIVLCEVAKLTQDEKRFLKSCQYGLALEVKKLTAISYH